MKTHTLKQKRYLMTQLDNIKYKRERIFAETFFDHNNWTYQPGPYQVEINGKLRKFTPDFWDGERDILIEVVGSRQAFNYNKAKYQAFKQMHPNFEVRYFENQNLINFTNPRVEYKPIEDWCWWLHYPNNYSVKHNASDLKPDIINVLFKENCTIKEFCQEVGISPTVYNLIMSQLDAYIHEVDFYLLQNFIFNWQKDPYRFHIKSYSDNKITKTCVLKTV